jgi:predicted nucleic acid-binding protein
VLNHHKPQPPEKVAEAIRTLVEEPSTIKVLQTDLGVLWPMLDLAVENQLTARRIHDARHAATAIAANVREIFTYDVTDWLAFSSANIKISGPPSILKSLQAK